MKCRACGYVSFEDGPCCKRCGADREGRGGAPVAGPEPADGPAGRASDPASFADLAAEFASLRLDPEPPPEPVPGAGEPGEDAEPAALLAEDEDDLVAGVEFVGEEAFPPAEPAFHLDDDIIPPLQVRGGGDPFAPAAALEEVFPADAAGHGAFAPAAADPIIDRDEEIPERFWAPEGAPLGRRIAAQVVDQAALLALLALFYGGGLLALRIAGHDAGRLLTPGGLLAVLPPFALLALLLGVAYFTFFHGWRGRTPGKRLAGIEVRTAAGEGLGYGRALLRSLGGVLALAAAGIGLAWAFVDPRRRGWADRLSGTVVRSRHPA